METELVLAGLIRKRAEIASKLEAAQMRVRQLIIDHYNVDVTIRLFAPGIDLEGQAEAGPAAPHRVPQRDQPHHPLDHVRHRDGVTTRDISIHVMNQRSLNVGDPRLFRTVQKRVGASLKNLRNQGAIQSELGKGSNLL